MGKHSTGRARSGRDAVEDAPAVEGLAGAVALDSAPAPAAAVASAPAVVAPAPAATAAFSGWLPPATRAEPAPTATRAEPAPAPQPVLFSAAPSPLEMLAAPVIPVPAAQPVSPTPTFATPASPAVTRPAKPAVPSIAEAFAAQASNSWFAAEPEPEPAAPAATSALALLAASFATDAGPAPATVLEPVPDVAERPSQLLDVPVTTIEAPAATPEPAPEPEAAPEPELPPVPMFRADASAMTKGPDMVTPGGEMRREIARAHRTRKLGKVGGISILVGALVAAGVVGLVGFRERPVAHHVAAIPKPTRTQRTLLFALADPTGDEAALFASDSKAGTSTVTLLPSRVVTNVVGQGQVPLGRAVALANTSVASGSISDLLGVDVDASWRVTPATLGQLIDSVGGITADVDTDIVSNGVVIVRAGAAQHLGGANAVAYAQYLASGEDETARLARLQRVLQGLLAVLPAQAGRLPAGLGALGAGSESTLTPAVLATQLLNAESGNRTAAVPGPMFSILPVTTIDSGGATSAYRVDPVAMKSYVAQNLAASVPPGAQAGGIRVFVYSGTLEYGVGTAARQKLVDAGLSFVGSDNESAPSEAPSVVLVRDGTDASRAQGLRVAQALGLPASSIEVSNLPQTVADVIVIAGGDFRH